MIKQKIKEIMKILDFPLQAQAELVTALDKLMISEKFVNIINDYNDVGYDFINAVECVKQIAQELDICTYTANMVFILALTPKLHKLYNQKGIEDKIFYNTLLDLKYKLEECRLIHNCCGTFVPTWYKGFFAMRIFALGRLQFEINNTWFECNVDGRKISKGTKVLSVHIPRTCTPLYHELVIESYNTAKEFFKDEFDGNIIFICNSWLLDPWNRTVLKDGSNLAMFYDDFTIVEIGKYVDYSETWRLFDCLYDGNINDLPCDTSLRRAYIERIKSGQPTGYATGVIITKK